MSTAYYEAASTLKASICGERQANRLLHLSFPRGDGPEGVLFVANGLVADEGLGRDFVFTVEILSDAPDIELKTLMGKLVTVRLTRTDGSPRYFSGHVFEFGFVRNDAGFAYYEMILRPWLAFLHCRQDNRLFHGLTVAQQTEKIFGRYLARDWTSTRLGRDEPMTDACQWNESDHNYLHRRWESRGWHYRYEHREDGHTLVLCGDSLAAPPIDGDGEIEWVGSSGVRDIGITQWSSRRRVSPTCYAATSFDFKSARPRAANQPTLNKQGEMPDLEVCEYAGAYGFNRETSGDDLTRRRIEAVEAEAKHFDGIGDDDHAQAGRCFDLVGRGDVWTRTKAPDPNGDDRFLILEVVHTVRNNFETHAGVTAGYSNTLRCIRRKIRWRPRRGFNSVEPKLYGLQTALVVGPKGEVVYTDELGRVRVQFHWDREGEYDARSSAWVRVASSFAGSSYGEMALPRIGQEVTVMWLDGNPDRPLIIGRQYNASNRPPTFGKQGGLPANKALSGWSTCELGGGREQQLRFDDTPGRINVQLASEHAASQVNLGFLGTPMREGRIEPRGEGLEVRTRAALALRGEQGVFVTADPLPGEASASLDRAPLIGLSEVLQSIQQQLTRLADAHRAGTVDGAKLDQFIRHLKEWENGFNTAPEQSGGGVPMVALSAPSGVALGSGDHLLLGARTHIDALCAGNTHIAAGQQVLLHAGQGLHVFAHEKGITLVTGKDNVDIRSDAGEVVITAAKRVVLRAGEEIVLEAPRIRQVTQGAQVDIGGGQITQQSSGAHVIRSSTFAQTGPGGGAPPGLVLPATTLETDERYVLRLRGAGTPVANRRYRIELNQGGCVEGRSDAMGRTQLVTASAMEIAAITVFND